MYVLLMFVLIPCGLLSGQHKSHTNKPTQQTANHAGDSVCTFSVVNTLAANEGKDRANGQQQKAEEQPKILGLNRAEFVQSTLALVLVVITAVYAGITCGMLKQIKTQAHFMKKQLTEMGKQTSTALSAAHTAESHYRTTRNAERPWILVEKIKLNKFGHGEELIAYVSIKNYGRTPAFMTEHRFVFHRMKSVPSPPLQYSPFPFEFQQEILVPSGIGRAAVRFHEERLTFNQFEAVRDRKEFLYVFGFIKYRDGTGPADYETRFFQVYDLPVIEGWEFMPTGPIEYNQVK